MDDLVRLDGELVKRLRREKGWTQARLSDEIGSVGVGWVRKVEAGKTVRMEWNNNSGVANAGEDLAVALRVELDTLILDLVDGRKIKRLREGRNQSPEQFAECAHLNVEVVRAAEAGQFVHRVDTRSLAEALDVPPFELLFMEEAKEDEVKGLNFDAEDSRLNMRAGMVALGLSIHGNAQASGKPIPADEDVRKEAHGRLMFAVWKLGKDVGTEGSLLGANSPYMLAIETAIGSELAAQIPLDPDADPIVHAKRLASGLDDNMILALSHYEITTRQTLNFWIEQRGLELDWGAPDVDLRDLWMVGAPSLAHAIFSNASGTSNKLLKACTRDAAKIMDFLCVFVSRHYRYLSTLSPNDHAEFIRLVMVFVVACYTAGKAERRLTFFDAVEIERAAEDAISAVAARIIELSPEPKK